MVMLARALGIEPIRKPDLTKYTDAAQVSAYAQGYVAALIEAGIVGGVTADELAPQDNITRAATVTILDRAISTYADEAGATVKADGKGIVLVVADDVTVTGDVDNLLVPADNVDVTVSGSKNIDDITVTGDNSKVILNNSTANDVTLDGKNTELETKSGSKVENVSVTEDAKGATVNAGSGTTVKNVENSAADTTITGSGSVKNVASDTDITVETKNTNVENSGDEKITVTDAKGKDSTVSATGSGSSTTVNKETTSSGSSSSGGHSHSYDATTHKCSCGTFDPAVVATIGNTNGYLTLEEAVTAATSGQTVTLVKDCSGNGIKIASGTVTIDLNGKTYTVDGMTVGSTGTETNAFQFLKGSTVTIKNGKMGVTSDLRCAYYFQNYANLTLEDVEIIIDNCRPCEAAVHTMNGVVNIMGSTSIKASGEYFWAENDTGARKAIMVNDWSASYVDGTQVTVNTTGEIEGDVLAGYYAATDVPTTGKSNLRIIKGTFNGTISQEPTSGNSTATSLVIIGGRFSSDPSAYVPEGYEATKSDTEEIWTVDEGSNPLVAEINGVKYLSLAKALAAAENGDTVKLVSSIQTDKGIEVAKEITLDMAENTITSSVNQVFTVTGSGDLTITGNGIIAGPTGEDAEDLDSKAVLMVNGKSAKLTVLNGRITAGGVGDCGMYGIYVADGGNVILGDADTKTGPTITTWFAAVGENNTTSPANITIYGGEYTAQATPDDSDWWAYFCAPVYASASGNINISGGTFNGYYGISSRYENVGQKLNISGGTFNGIKTALFADTQTGTACDEKRTIAITGGTFSSNPTAYVAEGYVAMKNDNGTWTVIAPTAIENGVTIKGIAGYERYAFSTISEAYDEISPKVDALAGLGQETCSADDFNAFYTDNGKITWTIYGKQTLVGKNAKDSQNNDIVVDNNSLTFGRAASYYGDCSLTEIEVKAGNESAALDLSATNGTFALPYNWWGQTVKNIEISFTGITFDGIKSIPGTWATPEQETPYTFDRCTFNGSVYGYHDYNINLTIKNSMFNAPDSTQYAIMLQSTTGISGKVTLDNNTFDGYTRGVNFQRPGTTFLFTNNTITSTVSEPDRAAIQLTDGESFTVTGNTVRVNEGNAFWFHDAATNSDVTYTISNNDIQAPYLGYYATTFDVNLKITSSGNNFNNTDTTKCMKKDATVAEATNLTAIH